jgi:hypothetical protein
MLTQGGSSVISLAGVLQYPPEIFNPESFACLWRTLHFLRTWMNFADGSISTFLLSYFRTCVHQNCCNSMDLRRRKRISVPRQSKISISPQANYTDWSTATSRPNLVPPFDDIAVLRGQCGRSPTVFNLSFLDWRRYFSFQVSPHLSSWGWVDPVPDRLLIKNLESPGIEPGTSGSPARNTHQ